MLIQLRAMADADGSTLRARKIHMALGPNEEAVVYCRDEGLELIAVSLDDGPTLRVNGSDVRPLLDRAMEYDERARTELRRRFSEPQIDAIMSVFEAFNGIEMALNDP